MKKTERTNEIDIQRIFDDTLTEMAAREPILSDIIHGFRKMGYRELKLSLKHSLLLNCLATPKGTTPLYLVLSHIKNSSGKKGVLVKRVNYYTRDIDGVESHQDQLSNRADYLERAGRFKKAKQEDVEFIDSNMGGNRPERRRTSDLIEAAEKSVKKGGKRRRHVNNAILMSSAIIALPAELSKAGRERIAQRIGEFIRKFGVFYLAVGHRPSAKGDQRNFHLHLMYSQRPYTHDLNGKIEFADKINRALQDRHFPTDLRQIVASACNEALAAEGQPRRIFADTYAENGLLFAKSRDRKSVKAYQRDRKLAEKSGTKSLDSATGDDDLVIVRFMADVVAATETRIRHAQAEAAAAQKVKRAHEARTKAVDEAMTELLRRGALFAFDKNTKQLKVADVRGGKVFGFVEPAKSYELKLTLNKEASTIARLVTKIGPALNDWLAQNSIRLMKSWAATPALVTSAIKVLGGQISFAESGSIVIKPKDGTWLGKGTLSWLADAVRNHAGAEVTKHLTGVDIRKPGRISVPTIVDAKASPTTKYAGTLSAGQSVSPAFMAALRRNTAAANGIPLARDTIEAIDKLVEGNLHSWTEASYLIQEHRLATQLPQHRSNVAFGLETEWTNYQSAIANVEKAAPNPHADLKPLVRDLLRTAITYYGDTSWQVELQPALTAMFERIKWMPANFVASRIQHSSLADATGNPYPQTALADLAQSALDATEMAKRRRNITEQQLQK